MQQKFTSNRAVFAGNAVTEQAKTDWILILPGVRNQQQPANRWAQSQE